MYSILRALSISIFLLAGFQSYSAITINPIIGDKSYFQIMGHAPSSQSDEQIRVACHLFYAEYILRSADVSHLNPKQLNNRLRLLDALHEYALRGIFPQNHDFMAERKPCFIDEHGTICAVGYLVEKSEGIEVAKSINVNYKYAEIYEMDVEMIAAWAEENGLSLKECAIIQPTYDWTDIKNRRIEASGQLSWRLPTSLYLGAQLMYYVYHWRTGKVALMRGIGLEYQNLGGSDFSGALKIQFGFMSKFKINPYLSLNPEFYVQGKRNGFNLEPEVGIKYNHLFGRIGITSTLNYGYHFRIINPQHYSTNRNDISFTIGASFNIN